MNVPYFKSLSLDLLDLNISMISGTKTTHDNHFWYTNNYSCTLSTVTNKNIK